MTKVRVIDIHTGQCLFECSLQESEKAYQFAAQMEEMGLEIKVVAPTLSQSLGESLGMSKEDQAAYQASLEAEIDEHEGSCCFEDTDPNRILN